MHAELVAIKSTVFLGHPLPSLYLKLAYVPNNMEISRLMLATEVSHGRVHALATLGCIARKPTCKFPGPPIAITEPEARRRAQRPSRVLRDARHGTLRRPRGSTHAVLTKR